MPQELITLKEAARRLGISRTTMGKRVKEGRFTIYENPLDRREKLVDAAEVDRFMQPRQIIPASPRGEARHNETR